MTAFLRAQFHRGVSPAVLLLALLLIAGVCSPGVALATIVYTGSSSGANNLLPTNGTADALTIAKPAGTVAGQALIATIAARPSLMTVTVPANWYPMTVTQQPGGGVSTLPGGMTLLTYYHIVGLGEPASYTWTFANTIGIDPSHCPTANPPSYSNCSAGGSAVGGLLAFSGIDTSGAPGGNPINVWTALLNVNAIATGITTTPITPTAIKTMIVSSLSYLSGDSFNPPTLNGVAGVLTERLDQRAPVAINAVGTTLQMSTVPWATTSTTGAARAIAVSNDDTGVGHLMALTPSAIDLAITMTRSAPLNPGGSASYTLKVINNGINSEPGPISVVDTLPAGLSYASFSGAGWACVVAGLTVTCTRTGALAADAPAADLVINVNVSAGATGTLTNTATVFGTGGDKNTYNDTATDSYTFIGDLALSMSSGALNPGQNGTFTLNVSNIGTATDPGPITITDTLPAGLSYVSGTGTGWTCVVGPPVTCTRTGTLGNGAAAGTLTLTVAVAQTGFTFTNTATVSSIAPDNNAANNSASVTYNVSADLALTMTRGAALVPGANATYTFSVTNNGPNVAPQPIIITDTLPAGLTYVSGVGTNWTCGGGPPVTCTLTGTLANGASSSLVLTVAVAAGASGTINNTATVTGTATDSTPANNTASDSYIVPLPTYAYYKMDEASWIGTAGEVKDSSGNSRNASRIDGTVNTVLAPASGLKGNTCMGAIIPQELTAATQMGVNTPINPNALGLGTAGTVSFWYKNNVAWTASGNNNDRTLLDATGGSTTTEFWLVLQQTGILQFSLDNASGTIQTATGTAKAFAVNTWHHIAITWDFTAHTMFIYVDGAQNGTRSNSNVTSETPNYGTFFVGDSKTNRYTNPNRGNSANGVIDEVRFYASALTAAQITTDMNAAHSCFDHLRIKHDGEGSTCAAESITVEACADAACTALVTAGGISATLQPFGTAVSINTSGSQTLSASPSTAGTNTLNATSINPAPANTTVSCLNTVTSSASCDLLVSACPGGGNFNCLETSITPYSNGTARLYTKLAATAFSFDVAVLNSSGAVETNYVVSGATAKNVTVELFDDSVSVACNAYASPVASQTLSFGSANSGRKTTASFTVPNAYKKLRCRVTDANMAPTAYGCSTDDFSVRPSAATLVTSATAAAPSVASTPTIKAGANFTLGATTSASGSYSGILTLDIGKLTAQTPSQDSTQQSGGAVGTLTPSSLTANATAVNATYSEVGYLYLAPGAYRDETFTAVDSAAGDCITSTASDNNLADTLVGGQYGCHIGNKTAVSLGRFIPDHFDTAVTGGMTCTAGLSAMTPTCPATGFVYSGQPFTTYVTARNASGVKTDNYSGVFAKAVTLSAVDAAGGAAVAVGSIPAASSSAPAAAFVAGMATLPMPATAPFTYQPTIFKFTTEPTNPTNMFVRAVEAPGGDAVNSLRATAANSVEGGFKVVSGRIKIANAHGSELLPLPIVVTVQYWDGSTYVTNTADGTTSLAAADILRTNGQKNTFTGCPAAPCPTSISPAAIVFNNPTNGFGKFTLSKPNVSGSVDMAVVVPADCATVPTQAACYLGSNTARATFGVYKGNNEFIYLRENY